MELAEWMELAMGIAFVAFVLTLAGVLWRVHRDKAPEKPSLLDLLTATDRQSKVRFDARKCYESGAFFLSSWAFVYLVVTKGLTEWFFIGYMATWVTARFLRDREQRLANGNGGPPAAKDGQ